MIIPARIRRTAVKTVTQIVVNLRNIIFALAVSVVIWVAISFQIFPVITIHVQNIPVTTAPTAVMLENNLEITPQTAEAVSETSVQIAGKRRDIGSLSSGDFKAYLDLSDVDRPGEYNVKIVVTPNRENITYSIVSNNTTHIRVIETMTREFPVIADLSGIKVRDDMKIDSDSVIVKPEKVTVKG